MNDKIPDYSSFKQEPAEIGGNLMSALCFLADQQQQAEGEVERLQALLDEAKKNVQRISEHEIPKLLDGLDGKINLPDGRVITVTEKIRSGTTGDKKIVAIKWLDDNGHGAIVKRQFIIEFSRDQEEWAKEFEQMLSKSKTPLNVKKERSLHHATLEAFVRQALQDGEDIPLDTFGVYRQRFAKIKGD
jgi:hypothetical protein